MIRNVTLYNPERHAPRSTTQLKVFPNQPFYPQQPNINVTATSLVLPIKQIHKSLWHNMIRPMKGNNIPRKISYVFLDHNASTVYYWHIPKSWTPLLDGKHNYPKSSFQLRNTHVYFSINQLLKDVHQPIKLRMAISP